MKVYRISKCNFINDLSGIGSATYGGRWNNKGTHVLYTAQTASLALLESIVHLSSIPTSGLCILSMEIPDNSFCVIEVEQLPKKWYCYPSPERLKNIGDQFIKQGNYLAMQIPSSIIPEEFNYLINPLHPDFKKIKLYPHKPLMVDERLIK